MNGLRALYKKLLKQSTALVFSLSLVPVEARDGFAYQTDACTSQPPPEAAQESTDELQHLIARIALYSDALIAQILAASTYPDEV
jgi:hypothetical protein